MGVLAVPLCKWADHAYLFEASPRVFRLLRDNLRLNDVSNATAFNHTVGETDGDITFRLGVLNTGGSKREPMNGSGATLYGGSLAELIQVPMRRMDDLLADVDGEIDLIVMDIEGSEHFALMGMPETLARTKALVVEFIWHHLDNVAGATVDEFLSTISPHFEHLYVPSKGVSCTRDAFSATLRDMHARKQHDDGLIFSRVPFRPWVRRGSPLRRDVARNGLAIGGV